MYSRWPLFGIALGLSVASIGVAAAADSVVVAQAWTRVTPPGSSTGAGYLTLTSLGRPDRLISAESPRIGRVEFHGMSNTGGVMKMWRIEEGIRLPAGEVVQLAPGGIHLMFFEIGRAFGLGEKIPLVLHFEKAGLVRVELSVEPLGAKQPASRPAESKR